MSLRKGPYEARVSVTPPDSDRRSITQQLPPGARTVLLLAPPMERRSDEACATLLGAEATEPVNALFVTLARSPDEQLGHWQARAGDGTPTRLAFVAAGDSTRSDDVASPESAESNELVRTVSSPGDLTGIGIQISDVLSAWADDDNQTVLCFHSLTTLHQYVDVGTAFRFFHVLTSRLRTASALGHFHADPSAHEERTLNRLKTLFDAVAEWTGESWAVSSR